MRALALILLRRSARERVLLAVLLLIVVPFSFAALVVVPLQDRRAAQINQLMQAQALLDWLAEEASSYVPTRAATTGTASPSITLAPITGIADLEQALTEAGLRADVTRLNMQDQSSAGALARSRITLGFDAVAFEPAMTWLSGLAARGVEIRTLRVQPIPDTLGQIQLNVALEIQS